MPKYVVSCARQPRVVVDALVAAEAAAKRLVEKASNPDAVAVIWDKESGAVVGVATDDANGLHLHKLKAWPDRDAVAAAAVAAVSTRLSGDEAGWFHDLMLKVGLLWRCKCGCSNPVDRDECEECDENAYQDRDD